MGDVVLSHELIEAGSNNGGYCHKQLKALGVPFPLREGWKRRLVGRSVPSEVYRTFLALRKRRRSGSSLGSEYHVAQLNFLDKLARDG